MSTETITANRFKEIVSKNDNVELLDVRTPVEFRELHVEFARNLPLDRLDPGKVMQSRTRDDQPLYVVCRSGGRGQQACDRFAKAGYAHVINIEGGTLACEQAGLPIVRGQKAISLERQVRIAAGSLVLIGVLLGWFVHPAFFAIAAFIGGGLVFSGITDTCGMGMLLARMPWNRCQPSGSSCRAR